MGEAVRRTVTANRWLICVAAGLLLYVALPAGWGAALRGATAWIGATIAFLAWTVLIVGDAPPERLRELAQRQDLKASIIFALAILAALASLIGVSTLLKGQHGEAATETTIRILLVAAVVITAWLLIHTMFAIHYMHGFYGDGPKPGPEHRGGVQFPGEQGQPDFWDFVYFSLIIGMTSQVSDVQITGSHIRRLATVHGALSFFYNTVIVAFTVNLVVNAF
jgi:uncharacterized membrane protein